ncbi:MAG: YdcF family protein [Rhodobacteraceae bacterium]|nr:YdcF family protein [Paracoccaceae bacterium]
MSEDVFFAVSKIIWAAMRPDVLLAVAILGVALWALRRRRLRGPLLGLLGALAVFWLFGAVPFGPVIMQKIESGMPRPATLSGDYAGVIVLGGGEDGTTVGKDGKVKLISTGGQRQTEAIALMAAHPDWRLAFTGGSGNLFGGPSGADLVAPVFAAAGIAQNRIVLEGASRNTWENAVFLRRVLQPKPGSRWLLITSAWHMPRAYETFCAAGWRDLTPWPVDPRGAGWPEMMAQIRWSPIGNYGNLGLAMKEVVGIVVYRLTGRASTDCN